jgi:LysR family transcriptional regulator, low CO2-responsive transcriptional regulator
MLRGVSITFTQLSTFLAVARTGSVKAAAEELVVTQPSVSAAISALARELGVDLTERVGRTIRLTPAGEAFVPYAADVLGLVEQGRRATREAVDTAAREVRIAAVTTAAEYVVPSLLQRFSSQHPGISLTLEVGNRQRVFQRLLDHDADVAIGGSPPEDGRLLGRPFLANEIVLIVPPGDELADRRAVTFAALAEHTWLLREEGSGTRALVEGLLDRHGIRPKTLTLGSNGAIKQGVRMGLGVSLQSLAAVDLELEAGLLAAVPLRGLPVRHWYLLTSAAGVQRRPVRQFVDFVAAH